MKNLVAVFDADGVFLRTTNPGNYLEHHCGLSPDQTAPFYKELGQCILGKADLNDVLPPFLKQWEIEESVDDFLYEAFSSGCEVDPEIAAVVEELRDRGIPCALATNQDAHRMAFLDARLNLRTSFDAVFVSCELGVKKPSREYFHAIKKHYAESTLAFWDDRPENVSAAQDCGWTAFVFRNVATLRNDIFRLLGQT